MGKEEDAAKTHETVHIRSPKIRTPKKRGSIPGLKQGKNDNCSSWNQKIQLAGPRRIFAEEEGLLVGLRVSLLQAGWVVVGHERRQTREAGRKAGSSSGVSVKNLQGKQVRMMEKGPGIATFRGIFVREQGSYHHRNIRPRGRLGR